MTKTNQSLGTLAAAAAVGVLAAAGMLLLTMLALVEPAGAAFPGKNGKIVFSTNRDGNYEIYTMNTDRSGLQRLTNHPRDDTDPAFSSDGSQIAFVSDRDGDRKSTRLNSSHANISYAV